MKKLFGLFLALAVIAPFHAEAARERLDAKQLAIKEFVKLETAGLHQDLLAQIKKLRDNGFTQRASTDAVTLGGGCGFAGCDELFLVTTTFRTEGANTQSAVVAAIVSANDYRGTARFAGLLGESEVQQLVNR